MALYRVRQRLALGDRFIERGSVQRLTELSSKAIAALVKRGAISEVAPPPLSELPRWRVKANALVKIGIVDAVQLMEGDADEIAKRLRVSRGSVVGWQQEMERWLVADAPPRSG